MRWIDNLSRAVLTILISCSIVKLCHIRCLLLIHISYALDFQKNFLIFYVLYTFVTKEVYILLISQVGVDLVY